MRLLVFGIAGQIGHALTEAARQQNWEILGPSHTDVDICGQSAVTDALRRYRPTAIVNAAGFTAVDRAESEREQAFRVNRDGARVLAEAAAAAGLPLIHLSTDYVFDGAATTPYIETDAVGPLSIYAISKEAGERAVRSTAPRHVILRTAWVYSPFGTNFIKTMLHLGTERTEISVVDDQTGCPTAAADIAGAITTILQAAQTPGFNAWGTYHYAGTDAVTWYGFARAIFDCAAPFGVRAPNLHAVATTEISRPAPRPVYSVLSTAKLERTFGIRPKPLRESLTACLMRLCSERETKA
jgi:dTDP-4-dehydrorhamnose reductase